MHHKSFLFHANFPVPSNGSACIHRLYSISQKCWFHHFHFVIQITLISTLFPLPLQWCIICKWIMNVLKTGGICVGCYDTTAQGFFGSTVCICRNQIRSWTWKWHKVSFSVFNIIALQLEPLSSRNRMNPFCEHSAIKASTLKLFLGCWIIVENAFCNALWQLCADAFYMILMI